MKDVDIEKYTYKADDNYLFGETIKKLRMERGLSQVDVAKKMNVTPGYISNVEKGRTAMSLRMMIYYAAILDMSLDSLVGKVDPTYKETSIDREISELVSKLGVEEKKKLLETLKIWTN